MRVFGADANERTGAILILDQSGFTKTLFEEGVQRALDLVWRLRRITVPVLRDGGGEVYKVDADNVFAFFADVDLAVAAAERVHAALAADEEEIEASVGIGYGTFLHLPSEDDYFGGEVNVASKLGEDVAGAGETLLTAAARAQMTRVPETLQENHIEISGLHFTFFRVPRDGGM